MPTHYEVLGVDRDATLAEIKRAFHRRARLYHPDAHVDSAPSVKDEAERTMQALNLAWDVLQDDEQRRRYDRGLDGGPPGSVAARRQRRRERRRLSLGSGFSAVMGSAAMPLEMTVDGKATYCLRVTGTRDLSPLEQLAPDRLLGLYAAGMPIGDDQLRHLRGMRGLRLLELNNTPVTDVGMLHLLGCESLESLWLWDTAITDAGADLIARLPRLRRLALGNTHVTDAGLERLGTLRYLRLLHLAGTPIEGPGLVHLHGLTDLEIVTLPWKVRGRHRRNLRAALPPDAVVA